MPLLHGRVVVVTGAGGGLGRSHARCLAAQGAKVVVNDVGGDVHGRGSAPSPAETVVDEIRQAGGTAVADAGDVTDPEAASSIVQKALDAFGRLDAVVNNAGILRDRTLANMEPDDWDAVMSVHLRGTYCVTRAAVQHWRALAKSGEQVDARVVCTSSASGLYGNVGQANYAAAKAGIVGFVLTLAKELERYGISVNALSPGAHTRMTDGLFGMDESPSWSPDNVAPAVAWLVSPAAKGVTGAVLEVENGWLGLAMPWMHGPRVRREESLWTPEDVAETMPRLLARYHELLAGSTEEGA